MFSILAAHTALVIPLCPLAAQPHGGRHGCLCLTNVTETRNVHFDSLN